MIGRIIRLGAAFEAAALTGVPLFHPDPSRVGVELDRAQACSALLSRPRRARPPGEVDDAF